MVYIYDLPEFKIPKEFQDWLVWAWNWQQASDWSVVDLSGNWHNWTPNWWVILWRKNNAHFMQFDGNNDTLHSVISSDFVITWDIWLIWVFKIFNNSSSDDDQMMILSLWKEWENIDTNIVFECNYDYVNNKKLRLFHEYWSWNDQWNYNIWPELEVWKTYFVGVSRDTNKKEYYYFINWYTWTVSYDYNPESGVSEYQAAIWCSIADPGWAYFNWQIWLAMVYNKALSPTQIQKMYEYFRQWYYD